MRYHKVLQAKHKQVSEIVKKETQTSGLVPTTWVLQPGCGLPWLTATFPLRLGKITVTDLSSLLRAVQSDGSAGVNQRFKAVGEKSFTDQTIRC